MYANYTFDDKGNIIGGKTTGGMNVLFGSKQAKKEANKLYQQAQEDTQQNTTATLEERITKLEAQVERLEKQGIVVVGDFDGTNIPITIHGTRRKIATVAP